MPLAITRDYGEAILLKVPGRAKPIRIQVVPNTDGRDPLKVVIDAERDIQVNRDDLRTGWDDGPKRL